MAQKQQWVVVGAPVADGSLTEFVGSEPAIEEVSRPASDTAVLAMSAADKSRLSALFGGALMIEPDADLVPPAPPPASPPRSRGN